MRMLGKLDEPTLERGMAAANGYIAYVTDLIQQRKDVTTDDLLGILVHSEVDGARLDDFEVVIGGVARCTTRPISMASATPMPPWTSAEPSNRSSASAPSDRRRRRELRSGRARVRARDLRLERLEALGEVRLVHRPQLGRELALEGIGIRRDRPGVANRGLGFDE